MVSATVAADARRRVRALMPIEGDLAFRRRCETILEFLDPAPGETVLDCGCGYGFTLRMLAALTDARLIGLDLGLDRLQQARAALGGRVQLVRGNAQQLPFEDGAIPKAVSSEVLEHLPDDAACVRELFRVLRPGGTLAVTVPCSDYPAGWDPFNWVMERTTGRHIGGERTFAGIWYGHLRLYDQAGLRQLLEGAGLVVEEIRPLTHYVPPASHLVMYGILKPLLMSGKLPGGLASAGDRLGEPVQPRGVTALAARAMDAIDRLNDAPDLAERKSSFVCLAARARKPR